MVKDIILGVLIGNLCSYFIALYFYNLYLYGLYLFKKEKK